MVINEISLGILLVYPAFSSVAKGQSFLPVDSEDYSEWTDAQADLSFLGEKTKLLDLSHSGSSLSYLESAAF